MAQVESNQFVGGSIVCNLENMFSFLRGLAVDGTPAPNAWSIEVAKRIATWAQAEGFSLRIDPDCWVGGVDLWVAAHGSAGVPSSGLNVRFICRNKGTVGMFWSPVPLDSRWNASEADLDRELPLAVQRLRDGIAGATR